MGMHRGAIIFFMCLISPFGFASGRYSITEAQVLRLNEGDTIPTQEGRVYGDLFFSPDRPILDPEELGLTHDPTLCLVTSVEDGEGVWRGRAILEAEQLMELRSFLSSKGIKIVRDFSAIGRLVVQAPYGTCAENLHLLSDMKASGIVGRYQLDLVRGAISYQ